MEGNDQGAQIAAALQQLAAQQQQANAVLAQQQAQLDALAAQRAQAAQPQPTMNDLDTANKALLDNFVQNPLRVVGEIIGTAEKRTEEKLRAEMRQLEQQRIAEEQRIAWEAEWLRYNPDIADPDVKVAFETALRQQDPRLPYQQAVEQAAAATRQWKQNVAAKVVAAQEAESRRRSGTAMPTPSGYGDPHPQAPQDELAMRREMFQQAKLANMAKRMKTPLAQAAS